MCVCLCGVCVMSHNTYLKHHSEYISIRTYIYMKDWSNALPTPHSTNLLRIQGVWTCKSMNEKYLCKHQHIDGKTDPIHYLLLILQISSAYRECGLANLYMKSISLHIYMYMNAWSNALPTPHSTNLLRIQEGWTCKHKTPDFIYIQTYYFIRLYSFIYLKYIKN